MIGRFWNRMRAHLGEGERERGGGGGGGRGEERKEPPERKKERRLRLHRRGGFGQHRLGRDDRAAPVGEGTTALQVVCLAAIEERDQRTGIEQQLTGHASTTRERTHDVAPPSPELLMTTSR